MILKKYKKEYKLNNNDLSKNLNISKTHLSLLMSGSRKPSNKLIVKILNYTKGKVDPNSFFEKEMNKAIKPQETL